MLRIISPCRDKREEAMIRRHVASVVDFECEHACFRGPIIANNRNAGMFDDGFDILQWDTDIRATTEDVHRIISHKDKIVGGAYKHRKYDRLCASVWTKEPLNEELMLMPMDTTELVKVPWVGAGLLFIPNVLLKNLERPYFRYDIVGRSLLGEDVSFCLSAQRSGIAIYLDGGCRVRHLTQPHHFLEETMSDFNVSNEVKVAIIERNIRQVNQLIYESAINARVADKADDKEMSARSKKELVRLEKLLDAYSEELKTVQSENQQNVQKE